MKRLENMKMKGKLFVSFGSIIILSLLIVIILIFSMVNISTNVNKLYKGPLQNVDDIWIVRHSLVDIQRAINRLMARGSGNLKGVYSTFKKTIDTDVEKLESSLSDLENALHDREAEQKLEEIKAKVKEGEEIRAALMVMLEGEEFEEAYTLNYNTYLPIVNEINIMAEELFKLISEDAKNFVEIANNGSVISIITGILITIIGSGIAFVILLKITKIIVEPIKQITCSAKEMYKGDMKAAKLITYEARDELGELADSMRGTMNNLDDYVQEISQILVQIAKGDLTQQSEEITDFLGDFSNIKESLVYILKRFNATLTDIATASEQVDSGSSEISQAADSLSEGTTNQATALQELTSTIENVTMMAQDSAKKTEEAYKNIKNSTKEAEEGSVQMEKLTKEMQRITEISQEIENIITDIEDIASQTNLLSLNASIEAARAGEAGRGFAVVADQIGKLASDSAKSAVNTRELIGKTLEEIEKGNEITVKTSKSFTKVINDMKEFAGVAQTTNETAGNQAAALRQVHEGIEQISSVVENIASAAEESSAISEELSSEANRLDKLVRRFKLFRETENIRTFED